MCDYESVCDCICVTVCVTVNVCVCVYVSMLRRWLSCCCVAGHVGVALLAMLELRC